MTTAIEKAILEAQDDQVIDPAATILPDAVATSGQELSEQRRRLRDRMGRDPQHAEECDRHGSHHGPVALRRLARRSVMVLSHLGRLSAQRSAGLPCRRGRVEPLAHRLLGPGAGRDRTVGELGRR